jgi:hypothetical protein
MVSSIVDKNWKMEGVNAVMEIVGLQMDATV